MARLYADENFPFPAVEELRRLGHDALTRHEGGQAGQAVPDEEVLAFAVTETRILITLNRKHFVRLHQVQAEHAGIIVCTFDPDFRSLAQRVHAALMAQPQMAGRLVRIHRPG
jgi:hypothetical protein